VSTLLYYKPRHAAKEQAVPQRKLTYDRARPTSNVNVVVTVIRRNYAAPLLPLLLPWSPLCCILKRVCAGSRRMVDVVYRAITLREGASALWEGAERPFFPSFCFCPIQPQLLGAPQPSPARFSLVALRLPAAPAAFSFSFISFLVGGLCAIVHSIDNTMVAEIDHLGGAAPPIARVVR